MPPYLKEELPRKLIHLSAVWIPISYMYIDHALFLYLLSLLTAAVLMLDIYRMYVKNTSGALEKINQIFKIQQVRYFPNIYNHKILQECSLLRRHEHHRLSGASYMLIAATICALSFSPSTFITAFLILVFADTAAALIGKSIGTIQLVNNKSLEGSLAFFTIAMVIISIMALTSPDIDNNFLFISLAGILITTILELYAHKLHIDDNFIIPVGFCLSFSVIEYLIR